MNREPDSTLIGLGVGTTKISVVVAQRDPRLSGSVQIMGIGSSVSQGIRKGLIVNLEQAKQAVRNAVEDAENMVGFPLSHATVSFNAIDVASVMSTGMISLERSRPIQVEDVERVIKAAKSELSIPANKVTLHTIPVRYSIDGNFSIDDPLGMTGSRLEIALQSVTVPTPYIQNVVNCVEASGLEVEDLVIKPIAAALGALTEEEMRVGAISLSIGGGATGLTYYKEGCPVKVAIIPIGGDHITRDLANVLRLPQNKAEELKKRLFEEDEDEPIVLAAKGQPDRAIDRGRAVEVVACRLEELFAEHIVPTIPDHDLKQFPGGIVLSGGVAQTAGIGEMLSDTFKMPVRVADPQDFYEMPPGRSDSSYVSALGTVRYILSKERNPYRFIDSPVSQWRGYLPMEPREPRVKYSMEKIGGVKTVVKKFWEFTKDFF